MHEKAARPTWGWTWMERAMNLNSLALVTNLRAWVVGFALWLVVDQVAGWRASGGVASTDTA